MTAHLARLCVALDAVRLEVDVLSRAFGDTQLAVLRQRINAAIDQTHTMLMEETDAPAS